MASLTVPAVALAQAAPANDDYLFSTVLAQALTSGSSEMQLQSTEDTSDATTQADLFQPNQEGSAQTGGGPEPLTCDGATYGKTVWYDVDPMVDGGLELTTAGFPTAIAVYQWSVNTDLIARRVGCQISASLENDFPVLTELRKGSHYTVQLGGLAAAGGIAGGLLEFTAAFFPDTDGDGVLNGIDQCPNLPGVKRFGGCPPAIQPVPRYTNTSVGSGTKLSLLRLDQIPGGSRVIVRCPRCGVRVVIHARPDASSATVAAVAGRTLAAGDHLEIWVTKAASGTGNYRYGAFGAYIDYLVGDGGLTHRVLRCLMPGSLTPMRVCPPGGRKRVSSHVAAAARVGEPKGWLLGDPAAAPGVRSPTEFAWPAAVADPGPG